MKPPSSRRSPWPYAIVLGLAIVAAANAVFIYVAVSGADPIAPSYLAERR